MRKEKKTHGTDSGPMAFGGFTSAALASLPPRISAVYDTACRTFARVGGTWDGVRAATANLLTSQARPLVDLVRRPIRVLSSILVSFPPPSLPRVQRRAPPAHHYQASGPYCITDGADRRERRQPACFLERQGGVCS